MRRMPKFPKNTKKCPRCGGEMEKNGILLICKDCRMEFYYNGD